MFALVTGVQTCALPIYDWVRSGDTGNSRPRRAGATAGSFSQQQFPSAHIFPSREEALVHGQTILPPMVHICGPGLNAIHHPAPDLLPDLVKVDDVGCARCHQMLPIVRSEEHTSELQSLMRISYAV